MADRAVAYFPFRGLDFELRREGAFIQALDREVPFTQLGQNLALDQSSLEADEQRSRAPLVTVITRTYPGDTGARRLEFLKQAGATVLNQTWRPLEWIVVEDGAIGNPHADAAGASATARYCAELAELYGDVRVRYLPAPRKGRSHAGNLGLEAASGEWICFLDDDDLLYADHLETLIGALQKDRVISEQLDQQAAVAAYARAFDLPTKVLSDSPLRLEEGEPVSHPGHNREFDFNTLLEFNYMPIQAVLFNRNLFELRGGFDTALDQLEDWNLWVRYAWQHRFVFVAKTTSLYRTPAEPLDQMRRQRLLDEAYEPVREKNHAFCNIVLR
jgi:glycosyltransferase involved in cell wall biosynthesis